MVKGTRRGRQREPPFHLAVGAQLLDMRKQHQPNGASQKLVAVHAQAEANDGSAAHQIRNDKIGSMLF